MPDFVVLDLETFTELQDELGQDPITDQLETFRGYDLLIKSFNNEGETIRFGHYI